jgi:hypothetical protein
MRAEMLTSEVREATHDAFGVAPINMFASTEGLVGHAEPGGEVFTFATDTCIAECVDDAGRCQTAPPQPESWSPTSTIRLSR